MYDPASDYDSEFSGRLGSLDAYRGLAMFLMVAEVLHLCKVAEHFPSSQVWQWLCFHQSHEAWVGCSLHDMIQPSFSFMVGVSLPFSLNRRRERGDSSPWLVVHAFWRALVLILLGIFLRSLGSDHTRFTFEDTLTQIGLGYGFLFLLGRKHAWTHWVALVLILVGYWGAFAAYPLPSASFDHQTVGVPQDWPHLMNGFEAHWNKNTNLAHAFDVWFLNLFPRDTPFTYNGGGYSTLSFIPTLGTMIMGLIAGGIIFHQPRGNAFCWLMLIGITFVAGGYGLEMSGYCPLVKRIWTPSFAIYSGGWCFIILAVLFLVIDIMQQRWLGFPMIVIGMNSILIYCMSGTVKDWVLENFQRHVGDGFFKLFDPRFMPLVEGSVVVVVFWLFLYFMYRNRAFLRI